jgi:transcription factor C subunit 7
MLASTLQGYFPEVVDTWAPVWFPSRNGENIEQLHHRMAEFMEAFLLEIKRRLPAEKHTRILLISHAAPTVGLVRHLLGDRELPFRPGCCSLTEIVPEKDGGWEAKILGGGAHLSEALSDWRQWGFEDLEADVGYTLFAPSISCLCCILTYRIIPTSRKLSWIRPQGLNFRLEQCSSRQIETTKLTT